jgi:hypothetical protein
LIFAIFGATTVIKNSSNQHSANYMKITKISYQKAFVVGPYLQEKIGVEIEVEDGDETAAFREAVIKVGGWHRDANPHLYKEETYPQPFPDPNRFDHLTNLKTPMQVTFQNGAIPVISKDLERLEIQIDNATTLEELAPIKEAIWQAGLTKQYMKKVEELLDAPKNFVDGL